jgi:hypothetical protein
MKIRISNYQSIRVFNFGERLRWIQLNPLRGYWVGNTIRISLCVFLWTRTTSTVSPQNMR